jgi:hypothetical protein
VKSLMKAIASHVSVDVYQRLITYSLLRTEFSAIRTAQVFEKREQLWDECIRIMGNDAALTYVEFGVHQGYSIKYFASHNSNIESEFIGLDSFEGLPEDWTSTMPKGTFDTKGEMPKTDDPRISFIKGWFQDTWDDLYRRIRHHKKLVVHYDADLYSSTLFALSKIAIVANEYIVIFDEFTGHEARAFYNFLNAYLYSVQFLGKVVDASGFPVQVMCRVLPRK